jgi:Tol biopolymer transport system component
METRPNASDAKENVTGARGIMRPETRAMKIFLPVSLLLLLSGLALLPALESQEAASEPRLANIRQLTDGGENAEAYFNPTDDRLIFQSTRPPYACDQIFTMNLDGSDVRRVSSGKGRTTCGYFLPGEKLLYASTHLASESCPPRPTFERGYVWPVYESYDLFVANLDGTAVRQLTSAPGYDAEATVSSDGSTIVFTSVRDGDLDLYSMRTDGSDLRRLTSEKGYDGGAFFSADGKQIVYRAHHPRDAEALSRYEELLAEGLIEPTVLEIFVMDADGGNKRQITGNGAANFCPYFHPDGRRIIFSSNMDDPQGRNFDLYLIGTDGTGLERVTSDPSFDGFPMFSRDGRKLVFASNRLARQPGETNIFVADWVP